MKEDQGKKINQVISDAAEAKLTGNLSDEDLDHVAGGATVTITVNSRNDAPKYTIKRRTNK